MKDYETLLTSLQKDFCPSSTIEELLIESIAQDYWRLRRIGFFEYKILSKEHSDVTQINFTRLLYNMPEEEVPTQSFNIDSKTLKHLDTLSVYQSRIQKNLSRNLAQLERIVRMRGRDIVSTAMGE